MATNTQVFQTAKSILRANSALTDEQVAAMAGVPERDTRGMAAIREARKDLAAGEHTPPDIKP